MSAEPPGVLLVDDVAEMRTLLRTVLRTRGMTVTGEAADGRQAVALAAELQPDVVVLDLGLPDLEGQEVLTGIRNHAPQCRVVVFSGTRLSDRAGIERRVEAFVTKGQNLDILLDTLEETVQQPLQLVTEELPHQLGSVSRARAITRDTLTGWGMDGLVGDGTVVVSELATNAVVHARSPFELRLSSHQHSLRIAVVDFGPGTPEPLPASPARPGGRGLQIVNSMATAWGVDGLRQGSKLVWAELPVN